MRLLRSFKYALKGIALALNGQLNIKVHLLAVVVVIVAGTYCDINTAEWCIITLCFGLVLMSELMNTALETIVDIISPDFHPLAGRAKDIAAGAVLIAAISTAVIAIFIFKKYIFPA
jgi:hypothetical protein